MKTTLLSLVICCVSFAARAQPVPDFDGAWEAAFSTKKGNAAKGLVSLQGRGGTWDMDVTSKSNPCTGLKVPLSIKSMSTDGLVISILRSNVMPGCRDNDLNLVAVDANTLQGIVNGQSFTLRRSAGDAASPSWIARTQSVASEPVPGPRAPGAAPIKLQMIYFGGNDCPPCIAWRGVELPKLRQSEVFKTVEFIYVDKTVMSPVPAEMFLPGPVKPYKAKLDAASGGNRGSAQTAIMVDGEVFDYYYGARDAQDILRRIEFIQGGGRYPFPRCLELVNGFHNTRGNCARSVPAN